MRKKKDSDMYVFESFFLCFGISFKAEALCEKLFYAHSDCIVLAVCKEIFREMFAA